MCLPGWEARARVRAAARLWGNLRIMGGSAMGASLPCLPSLPLPPSCTRERIRNLVFKISVTWHSSLQTNFRHCQQFVFESWGSQDYFLTVYTLSVVVEVQPDQGVLGAHLGLASLTSAGRAGPASGP